MEKLIAIAPILFESVQYIPGDELPIHNSRYVEAWIENGAAEWRDTNIEQKPKAKARAATAEPGLAGEAYPATGSEPDLVGKVPSRKARARSRKRRRKEKKANG